MPVMTTIPALPPRPVAKKRVAAYARVSLDTEMLLHSLSAQISHYSKLIKAKPEWEYAGIYADEGISGRSTVQRDQFNRLMADCEAGLVDIVLVKSISRFARDTVDCLKAVRHLKDIGVEVRFEREGISTFSEDGELLLTLLASFAQAESESISANVKWATRKRFEEGIPNGHKPPYGYEWDGEMFRIIPEQGKVVKYIYHQYLAGASAYAIAKALKEQGVVGQNGAAMCDSTIRDIVTNTAYTGTMILQKNYTTDSHTRKRNRGELPRYAVQGIFEQLISADDFERACAIRQKRAAEANNTNPTFTRFSGLMVCGYCGHGISRRTAKGIKKWVCNTRERKGVTACDLRPITEAELETAADSITTDEKEFKSLVRKITVYGDRLDFDLENGKLKSIPRTYGGHKTHCGFYGKLVCGLCGAKLERKTRKIKAGLYPFWRCTGPRHACTLRGIHEDRIRQATAKVMDMENFEPVFVEKVSQAVVFNDEIRYEFKDGTVVTWHI